MFCLASHHALFHEKKTGRNIQIEKPCGNMGAWEDLTALISFSLFILPVIPDENGIGISFGFYLIFQFVIVSFSNQSIAQIKANESNR